MINILLSIQTVPHKIVLDSAKAIIETRVVVDTLHLPANPTFEMMSQMKTFYQDSWTNLLWVVGGLFTVVGVALPVYVQNQLKSRFSRKLKEAIAKLKNDIKSEFNTELTELKKTQEVELKELSHKTGAILQQANGNIFVITEQFSAAVVSFLDATKYGIKLEDNELALQSFDSILDNLPKCTKSSIKNHIKDTEFRTFEMLIERLRDEEKGYRYEDKIVEVEELYKTIS